MEVVFCDKSIIVAVKPRGVISEDGPNSFPAMLKEYLCSIGENSEIYTVHRLDRDVSGIMVYARTKSAAANLSSSIQNGTFIKEYDAKIHGVLESESGTLTDYLFKDSKSNKVFVVSKERKGVKKAVLHYNVISSDLNTSIVHVVLETGRSHQIRVQFASRKHPLLGDRKYGAKDDSNSICLMSVKVTFPHPKSNKNISFSISSLF